MFRIATLLFLAVFLCAVLAVPVPSNTTPQDAVAKRSQFYGRGTWFYVGLGNCGWPSVDSDWVVALAMDTTYDNGSHCGRNVRVTANGVTQEGTVVDSCPGCSPGDLDMSPAFFKEFATLDTGVISVQWDFV